MSSDIWSAAIGAAIALTVGLVAAATSLATSRRQRSATLIIAAMEHMVGGSQERSAGISTLRTLRGKADGWHLLRRRSWASYAPYVGDHLFRQSIYVIHHGSRRYYAHEIENAISMIDWLTKDPKLDLTHEQCGRLLIALDEYLSPKQTASDKDKTGVESWVEALSARRNNVEKRMDELEKAGSSRSRVWSRPEAAGLQ